jgi:hypothetical protein
MTPTADDRGGVISEPTERWVFSMPDPLARELPSEGASRCPFPTSLEETPLKQGVGRESPTAITAPTTDPPPRSFARGAIAQDVV